MSSTADGTPFRTAKLFTPQDRTVVVEVGLPTILRYGRWQSELCFRHLTDPSRQAEVRWSSFALRDEFGGLIGAAAVTIDIAPCKQALPALRVAKLPWL